MSKTKQPEQRQYPRYSTNVPIEVWQEESCQEESVHRLEHLQDVSSGGVAFESDTYWKPGSIIILHLQLLNWPSCEATGEVVWCRKHNNRFKIGVKFLQTDCPIKEDLVNEVRQLEILKVVLFPEEFECGPLEYSTV
ncbi:MAG: hypothetical protein DRR08_02730 [Candidatus Parabeggiatoa sp. nov. 2]|nr:MAG: hypothetical protein B6247_07335 [Beggiatoa sp. 4572_84]RKZ63656.1 MAG: hypothetical protein DRR08_02730 [Gammaproteobacteria bacterium]HEC84666.1 PilZ domain-containing protein [Thioploca sp.]